MKICNAHLYNQSGLWEIEIDQTLISKITAQPARVTASGGDMLDADGGLVLPPFVEPHVHLDAVLTAGQPRWNAGGTLFEGIACWSERKQQLSRADLKERATTALKWQLAQGIQHVRTHVDVTDPKLVALQALLEVKAELAPWLDLQIVAFPQEGICSFPRGVELLEEALRMGADVVGAIPHFEFTREYGVQSVKQAFDLAEKYDRLVDVHCDEIDDEQSRFIEVVATEAYERHMGDRVTASHTTAMHSYNNAYTYKLFRLLGLAGLNFVANPLVNIHLQGRFDTYPKRRGVTRVKELLEAKLNVCFGHDDIVDPWYPLGTGNMLQVLHMGLHVCQLLGYEQIMTALPLITTNSARALNLTNYGLEPGNPANMIILAASDGYDAIRRQVPVRYALRRGQIIVKTQPAVTQLQLTAQTEVIDFHHSV